MSLPNWVGLNESVVHVDEVDKSTYFVSQIPPTSCRRVDKRLDQLLTNLWRQSEMQLKDKD